MFKLVLQIKKLVRKLVWVRNKIYKALKNLHYFKKDSDGIRILFPIPIEDRMNFLQNFSQFKNTPKFSPSQLFNIGKRQEEKEYDSEIEISDLD
mmetsp:Transcript_5648/g.4860  ORF Transcript_5648/g.4860 Transcript_5648/m.4860 type:complete len:94 (+) Transcript_5648:166-447(+)